MEKLLISTCLLGVETRYDGGHNLLPKLHLLKERYILISACPEVDGGLPTPRDPAERIGESVLTITNEDVTEQFNLGANIALDLCKKHKIKKALLKKNSPSCGHSQIYDGSFSGNLINRDGVTAELLKANRIKVYNEDEIDKLL